MYLKKVLGVAPRRSKESSVSSFVEGSPAIDVTCRKDNSRE